MDTVRSSDGTPIVFDRSGEGPPLILAGGALGNRGSAADIATHLAGDFTVIAFDRRGRGDSGDTAPYAVEREIEDIEALIRATGGSALVYGHSSGAVLALRAVAAGLGIERLAAYEPPFIVDGSRPPAPIDYVGHLDRLLAEGRRGDAVAYFMALAQVPAGAVDQMRHAPMWAGMEAVAHTLAYDGWIMGDMMAGSPTPLQRWSTLAIPTLVMDGGASPAWMRTAARTLAEIVPNAEYRTLEGQDHGPASAILAPILVEFFAR